MTNELNRTFLETALTKEALEKVDYLAETSGLDTKGIYAYFAFLIEDDFGSEIGLDQNDIGYELGLLFERLNSRDGLALIELYGR